MWNVLAIVNKYAVARTQIAFILHKVIFTKKYFGSHYVTQSKKLITHSSSKIALSKYILQINIKIKFWEISKSKKLLQWF